MLPENQIQPSPEQTETEGLARPTLDHSKGLPFPLGAARRALSNPDTSSSSPGNKPFPAPQRPGFLHRLVHSVLISHQVKHHLNSAFNAVNSKTLIQRIHHPVMTNSLGIAQCHQFMILCMKNHQFCLLSLSYMYMHLYKST